MLTYQYTPVLPEEGSLDKQAGIISLGWQAAFSEYPSPPPTRYRLGLLPLHPASNQINILALHRIKPNFLQARKAMAGAIRGIDIVLPSRGEMCCGEQKVLTLLHSMVAAGPCPSLHLLYLYSSPPSGVSCEES